MVLKDSSLLFAKDVFNTWTIPVTQHTLQA